MLGLRNTLWVCTVLAATSAALPALASDPAQDPIYFINNNVAGNHTLVPVVNVLDRTNVSLLVPNTTVTLDYAEERPEVNRTYVSQLLVNSTIPMFVPENSINLASYCENSTVSGLVNQIHFQALTVPVFETVTSYLASKPKQDLITITNLFDGGCNPYDTRGLYSVSNYTIGVKCPMCFSFGVIPVEFEDFASTIAVTYGIVNGTLPISSVKPSVLPSNLYTPAYDLCPTQGPAVSTKIITAPVSTVVVDTAGQTISAPTVYIKDPAETNTGSGPNTVFIVVNEGGSTVIPAQPIPGAVTVYQTINSFGFVISQSTAVTLATQAEATGLAGIDVSKDPTPYSVPLQNNYACTGNDTCEQLIIAELDSIGLLPPRYIFQRIANGLDAAIASPAGSSPASDQVSFLVPDGYTL